MAKKLFVGNLDRSMTDQQLAELFSPHGEVRQARVIFDRQTGESRRFGFVEMAEALGVGEGRIEPVCAAVLGSATMLVQ